MEDKKTKVSAWSKIKSSKKTPIFAGLIFLGLIVIAGSIIYLSSDSSILQKEKKLQTIQIGDITITADDVQAYSDDLKNEISVAGGSYEESEDTIALKDLVLNASLKKEAKDLSVTISDEEIVKQSSDDTTSPEALVNKIKDFRKLTKRQIVSAENVVYKKILEDKLIIKKSLLIAQSNFDTPYYKTIKPEEASSIYAKVRERLNNDIFPLMKNGATAEDISKKVDADFITNNKSTDELVKLYSTQPVIGLQRIENYSPGTQVFNDLEETNYIVGDVGKLENTDEKLSKLQKVGDTTDIFASRSGLFLIARLDASNEGKYNSWESLLQSYIDNHVKYAGINTTKFKNSLQDLSLQAVDKAILTISSPGLEEAEAQGYTCSQHTVRYRAATWIKPRGSTGGAPGDAQANPRVGFTPQPSGCVSNPDTGDGFLSRGETAFADCMTYPPNWGSVSNVQSSGNFKYVGTYVDLGGGGPYSSGARQAFPDDPPWTVATANATSNYTNYIWFVYEPVDSIDTRGSLIVSLLTNTGANCELRGIATFRPPGTNGSQDTRVPWRLSGQYTYPPGGGAFAGANTGRVGSDPRQLQFAFPNPAAVFPNGQGRVFTLWATYTYQGTVYNDNVTEMVFPPQPFGCNPPIDTGASAAIVEVDCNGARISGGDPNGTSGYIFRAYHTGLGAGPIYEESGPIGSGGFSKYVSLANLPPAPGSNNGYYYELQVYEIGIYGNVTGTRTAGASTGQCYNGTCSVNIVSNVPGSGVGPNAVRANESYQVNARITNNGPRPIPGDSFALTSQNLPSGPHTSGDNSLVQPGQSRDLNFQVTAPDSVTSLTYNFYPDYVGYFGIGPNCPVTVNVYKPYEIQPEARATTLLPDVESPRFVNFVSNAQKTIPPDADVPGILVTRTIWKNGAPYQAPFNSTHTLGNETFLNDTLPVVRNLNDRYCGTITVAPAAGWIGPNGSRTVTVPSRTDGNNECPPYTYDPNNPTEPPCADCVVVVNLPYVKTYGGDVAAGGGFKSATGSCAVSPTARGIFAYIRPLSEHNPTDNRSGSGSQLGAFAWGEDISGFTTASMKTGNPSSVGGNKLTFGNTVSGGSVQEPVLGGNLSGDPPCLPDYFTETQYPQGDFKEPFVNVAPLVPNNRTTGKQTLVTGDAVINGSTGYNKRHTVYVDGNVRIAGNITYQIGGVTDARALPNFTLVVRGNIYVDRSVDRLDGTYIAQPNLTDPGNTGRIYTCASPSGPITTATGMYSSCGVNGSAPQLRVNGSFIAEKVIFNRTSNSLADSRYRETSVNSKAAEIFTFSPDVYLSPPVFRPKSTVTSGDYQYIATLPPIL